ncbi:MAG: CTP synthase [Candidatus Cloacimonetes bacterium]|nr:CTP synthase [Candidatus Cloacimonadota bacterium]
MAKYIFVMGGVLSSLGKGIATASIGLLLKRMGYRVYLQKFDPYLNVDPGTMSPFQHGEVFVTDDGAETDLDLGHYERFVDVALSRWSSSSAGQVYDSVIKKERKGDYLGKTVQVIPHVTNEIKERICKLDKDYDIIISEIGGTVGDIESLPFLEAIRQLRLDLGYENTLYILLTYVPFIKSAGELKTKPTQHSAYKLREIGIQPDILLCRAEIQFDEDVYNKIALFTNVQRKKVINAIDVNSVYKVPLVFYKEQVHEIICRHFHLELHDIDLQDWELFIENILSPVDTIRIAVCGKYIKHQDAYKSVEEALIHSAAHHRLKLNIKWIDSEKTYQQEELDKQLKDVNGILIPGGFGLRGIEGKISIAQYARENNIPYFGICLGMQVAAIEIARNLCGFINADSTEFNEITPDPVIDMMRDQQYIEKMGGTMRLGAYPCLITKNSLAHRIYQAEQIFERHRHRYEFNNNYRIKMFEQGVVFSGTSPDGALVEIMEYSKCDFLMGVQFHPEFKSRPAKPHPIFREFIAAAKRYKDKQ